MQIVYRVRPMGDGYGPRPGIDMYTYGDGLFGSIWKGIKGVAKGIGTVAKFVVKNPITSTALALIPGGGLISKAVGLTSKIANVNKFAPLAALGAGGGIAAWAAQKGLGALGIAASGAPALPGGGGPLMVGPGTATSPTGGWGPRGPGNKMQWPWQDPNVQAGLKPWALDDSFLKIMYRAPRGYVVVHDENGKPYPLQKWAAKKVGWWHEPRKPPITAGEWHQYQTAIKVEKRLARIARRALHRHGVRTSNPRSVNIRESGPGSQIVQFRKKA